MIVLRTLGIKFAGAGPIPLGDIAAAVAAGFTAISNFRPDNDAAITPAMADGNLESHAELPAA